MPHERAGRPTMNTAFEKLNSGLAPLCWLKRFGVDQIFGHGGLRQPCPVAGTVNPSNL
jgi:hypothetical protein